MKIVVVIPAYNEEDLIGETLSSVPAFIDGIIVVNDCSSDHTRDVIEEYAKQDERIRSIDHKTNQGVGAAIVSGYKISLMDGYDITVVMAGDNQMDPNALSFLLEPIINGQADYVKGNRLINRHFRSGMSLWRVIGNYLLTSMTKIASGYWHIEDSQNGYTAITREALQKIELDNIYPRYGYCNDLLVKLNVHGFRVVDVPIPARYGREKSKIRYKSYIPKLSWLLFKSFIWRLKMIHLRNLLQQQHPSQNSVLIVFIIYPIKLAKTILNLFTLIYRK